jgi:hypothetical protein
MVYPPAETLKRLFPYPEYTPGQTRAITRLWQKFKTGHASLRRSSDVKGDESVDPISSDDLARQSGAIKLADAPDRLGSLRRQNVPAVAALGYILENRRGLWHERYHIDMICLIGLRGNDQESLLQIDPPLDRACLSPA